MKKLGADCFREVFTAGGDLGAHFDTLLNAPASQPVYDMLCGAILELFRVYQCVRSIEPLPRYIDKETDSFMHGTPNHMNATLAMKLNPHLDKPWLAKYVGYVIAVVTVNRDKVTFTTIEPTPPPPPAPLFVQLIGMPERVIESKVTYDNEGNIASTTQTEKDVSSIAPAGH